MSTDTPDTSRLDAIAQALAKAKHIPIALRAGLLSTADVMTITTILNSADYLLTQARRVVELEEEFEEYRAQHQFVLSEIRWFDEAKKIAAELTTVTAERDSLQRQLDELRGKPAQPHQHHWIVLLDGDTVCLDCGVPDYIALPGGSNG